MLSPSFSVSLCLAFSSLLLSLSFLLPLSSLVLPLSISRTLSSLSYIISFSPSPSPPPPLPPPPISLSAVPPLFVIEFLHRIVDVFSEYFGECSEQKIKDNYVTVYEVHTHAPSTHLICTLHSCSITFHFLVSLAILNSKLPIFFCTYSV